MNRNFLIGLGIGVGLGMLLAPMSGEETRNNLRERANDLADQAREAVNQGRERVSRGFEQVKGNVQSMASDIGSKASGQWGKLEDIFEDRVSRALKKLGVPTAKDIDALVARIDELNRSVAKLSAKGAAARTGAAATKPSAKRAKKSA